MPGSEDNKHPDAQINHSIDEVAGRIVKYIRELKPDIVLTFDPIGGYKHPDHIHVHQATRLAFEKADDPSFHPESRRPLQTAGALLPGFPAHDPEVGGPADAFVWQRPYKIRQQR